MYIIGIEAMAAGAFHSALSCDPDIRRLPWSDVTAFGDILAIRMREAGEEVEIKLWRELTADFLSRNAEVFQDDPPSIELADGADIDDVLELFGSIPIPVIRAMELVSPGEWMSTRRAS